MNKFVSTISWIFPAPLLKGAIVKSVSGKKNIPKGKFIFAANHLSHIDWLIDTAVLVPRRFTFIGQVDKMKGVGGFFRDLAYWYAEVIPVNRTEKESKKQAILTAEEMINRGYGLVIYPEGTRSRDGKLHEFKPGVARIYLETGAPIMPVVHTGTYQLMPPGEKFKVKKVVGVNIGKPIEFPEERKAAQKMAKDSQEYYALCSSVAKKIEDAVRAMLPNE